MNTEIYLINFSIAYLLVLTSQQIHFGWFPAKRNGLDVRTSRLTREEQKKVKWELFSDDLFAAVRHVLRWIAMEQLFGFCSSRCYLSTSHWKRRTEKDRRNQNILLNDENFQNINRNLSQMSCSALLLTYFDTTNYVCNFLTNKNCEQSLAFFLHRIQ